MCVLAPVSPSEAVAFIFVERLRLFLYHSAVRSATPVGPKEFCSLLRRVGSMLMWWRERRPRASCANHPPWQLAVEYGPAHGVRRQMLLPLHVFCILDVSGWVSWLSRLPY
eukprot:TRINITY_DN48269_c0_g1_i1.p1 TRINITY_DN48269_c0_g1~~TRINITY_DN48269_c0_g1_i1.p1  ORF type:complete len:111 (-),score=3.08 TRINITY_DN48269_c0_g1_i1:187-519(-)